MEVEQHDVESGGRERCRRVGDPHRVRYVYWPAAASLQALLQESGVIGIIFDE
jgi:hypothetical protein